MLGGPDTVEDRDDDENGPRKGDVVGWHRCDDDTTAGGETTGVRHLF
jgi:hypothetical protein